MSKHYIVFLIFFKMHLSANCIPINVMTYNIHYGMNSNFTNRDNNSSLDQVLTFIKDKNLDLVFLQEFPQGKKEYASYLHGEKKYPLNYIEKKLEKRFYIVEAITRNGNIYKGGKSLIILSKYKIIEKYVLNLPNPKWHQTRKAILLKLNINGKSIWTLNTHLCSQKNKINFDDLKSLLKWIDKKVTDTSPIIFGGDLNFDPLYDTPIIYKMLTKNIDGEVKYKLLLKKGFLDSSKICKKISTKHKNTFVHGKRKLDYIYYKNLTCLKYYDENSIKSDHYPIFSSFCINIDK